MQRQVQTTARPKVQNYTYRKHSYGLENIKIRSWGEGANLYAPIVQQLLKIRWWDRSDEAINQIVPLPQKPLTQRTLEEIIDTLNSI
jgi:hypothetical protein